MLMYSGSIQFKSIWQLNEKLNSERNISLPAMLASNYKKMNIHTRICRQDAAAEPTVMHFSPRATVRVQWGSRT